MSIYKELSVDQDIDTIKGIQFTLMSPDEIQRRSVAEILTTDTFNGNDPVIGGLFDPRMGVIEHNKICRTCEQKNTFCPGHFGHINLARPVFFIQFFDTVRKILCCVCFRCSNLLVNVDEMYAKKTLSKKAPRQKRFEQVYKACKKGAVCTHCGTAQPTKITKENVGHFVLHWKEGMAPQVDGAVDGAADAAPEAPAVDDPLANQRKFFADDLLPILSRINEKDAEAMGFNKQFNRPEWMICTTFPVPPPAVRPSVRNDTGQRSEDDLTHKLCDIVKTNNMLRQRIEKNASNEQIEYWTVLLQYHVSTFVDNQIPGLGPAKHRTGRPFRVLRERLKSKEGRIRGNLMGKRVDFSARSVITPDPNISIDELGVPYRIAMNLTFPEVVNSYNREELTKCMHNGPNVYPGAKFIRKAKDNYRTIALKRPDPTLELEDGDVVDRHMRNGDYVLFNRQPSLHKMSMMGHRVRIMPYDTFRLNVCVTPCFNADKLSNSLRCVVMKPSCLQKLAAF
jgi:DNA-directed RNA polymerase II subunit RPB1